jgi:hypothetical protein
MPVPAELEEKHVGAMTGEPGTPGQCSLKVTFTVLHPAVTGTGVLTWFSVPLAVMLTAWIVGVQGAIVVPVLPPVLVDPVVEWFVEVVPVD